MPGKTYIKKTTKKVYAKKAYKKPMGSAMAQQVSALSRQVAKLNKIAVNRIQYGQVIPISAFTAGGLDSYQAEPILKFNNWSRIFGTDTDDEVNKQALIKSSNFKWFFNSNENENRTYSMFVVSLKDNASELLNADGTLAALTSGTHYYGSQIQTLVNKNFFNIHYYKRFYTGIVPVAQAALGGAPAVQGAPGTENVMTRAGSFNIKYGTRGMQVKNPAGDWKAGVYPKDPSRNYFILVFWAGDSAVDGQYGNFNFTGITQVDVSA